MLGAAAGFLSLLLLYSTEACPPPTHTHTQPFPSYCSSRQCCCFCPSLSPNLCRRGPAAADISTNAQPFRIAIAESSCVRQGFLLPACWFSWHRTFAALLLVQGTPAPHRHAVQYTLDLSPLISWAHWGSDVSRKYLAGLCISMKEGALSPTKLWSNIWHMACM